VFPEMRPDLRSHTIWDTIRNTIEDPALTLYLVLDEAHRGMGKENGAKEVYHRPTAHQRPQGRARHPNRPRHFGHGGALQQGYAGALRVAPRYPR
jgi:type III restriction enzyme